MMKPKFTNIATKINKDKHIKTGKNLLYFLFTDIIYSGDENGKKRKSKKNKTRKIS